jgi:hypothetical protein
MVKRWQIIIQKVYNKWAIRSQGSLKKDQGSTTTQSILNIYYAWRNEHEWVLRILCILKDIV